MAKIQENFHTLAGQIDIAFLSNANFTSKTELEKSFNQFILEQAQEDTDNLAVNFQALERAFEKAFNNNRAIIIGFIQQFMTNYGPAQNTQINRIHKEALDHG